MENTSQEENLQSSNSESFTTIHLISILIGLASAALVISKEIQDENNPLNRTLYSLPLLLAGILFVLKLSEKCAPNLLELCSKKNTRDLWEQDDEEEQEKSETKSDSKEKKIIQKPKPSCCSATQFTMHFFPYFFFALSSVVSIHNVIDEKIEAEQSGNDLFLYTVLSFLMTGALFNLTFNKPLPKIFTERSPKSLLMVQNFIVTSVPNFIMDYRNILFLSLEYFARVLLRDYPLPRELITVPPAAFWTGFNVAESIKKTISNRSRQSDQPFPLPLDKSLSQKSCYTRFIPIATFSMGVGLAVGSMAMLEKDPLRNAFALWLASVGEYFITDPMGRCFSQCCFLNRSTSEKSHRGAVSFLTYLLIFFGNAKLTSVDLTLLLGAGICGGLAQPILDAEYDKKLILIQNLRDDINASLRTAPTQLTNFLRNFNLGEDSLLLEYRKKHRSMKITFNALCGLFVVVECALAAVKRDNEYTLGRVSSTAVSMPFMLILLNYVLPYCSPSKNTTELSFLQKTFYTENFFWYFLTKVAFCMTGNKEFINNQAEISNAVLFNVAVLGFLATTVYKHFHGGYKPYLPRDEDIDQLKILLSPESLYENFSSLEASDDSATKKKLILNYYLLQFVQENCLNDNKESLSFFTHLVRFKTFVFRSAKSEPESILLDSSQYGSTDATTNVVSIEYKRAASESHAFSLRFFKPSLQPSNIGSAATTTLSGNHTDIDIEVNSNDPNDAAYIKSCADISGRLTLFATAVRGPRIREQLPLQFPEGINFLSATSYVAPST